MLVKNFTGKNHRTALIVDVNTFEPSYQERVKRLLASVNGGNIKCDVFAVKDDTLTRVTDFASIATVATPIVKIPTDASSSVQAWAAEAGYTQVLVNTPA